MHGAVVRPVDLIPLPRQLHHATFHFPLGRHLTIQAQYLVLIPVIPTIVVELVFLGAAAPSTMVTRPPKIRITL